MIRVNRVTVSITDLYEPAIITLYRTNTKLVELTNDQLGVPDLCDSGVPKVKYQQYLKDVVINLLENGGIEGYYYEAKQVVTDTDGKPMVSKFAAGEFRSEAINRVKAQLATMTDKAEFLQYASDGVQVDSRYKDGKVKYGSTIMAFKVGDKQIEIKVEIRSGQICKPKHFTINGETRQLNTTNINRLMK